MKMKFPFSCVQGRIFSELSKSDILRSKLHFNVHPLLTWIATNLSIRKEKTISSTIVFVYKNLIIHAFENDKLEDSDDFPSFVLGKNSRFERKTRS